MRRCNRDMDQRKALNPSRVTSPDPGDPSDPPLFKSSGRGRGKSAPALRCIAASEDDQLSEILATPPGSWITTRFVQRWRGLAPIQVGSGHLDQPFHLDQALVLGVLVVVTVVLVIADGDQPRAGAPAERAAVRVDRTDPRFVTAGRTTRGTPPSRWEEGAAASSAPSRSGPPSPGSNERGRRPRRSAWFHAARSGCD